MTDMESRLETYFYRAENGMPTHRDDIGTMTERINKYKVYYSRCYHGAGKFINTNDCIDTRTKCDIILTLLEDGHIDLIEFRMRMNKLTIVEFSKRAFANPAFQSGLDSRRREISSKASVKHRLQKKHADKYSQ